ncbi:fatty acyl-CoA synthetase [Rhodopila globiformis]|uniref:3-methylmercaptopropionyl-CoA ligase n=1 Tax=Rhodopila globiformis TaxID=1071 RepID=A0A2S6MUY3_RHOGL|nr:fatty acyl-CoA synthetase [Rhodopila globiformis]PPQ26176.1 acyl-CoA synthetase [Rhodopila globiformis]
MDPTARDLIHRNTVGDAVRRMARLFRDRSALVFNERDWSFAALDRAADRVARHFAGMGLRPGDRIAAYGRNSDGFFITWLACVRGGFVHVPVNYALTGEELSYIVRQSGARLVVAGAALAGNLAGIDAASFIMEDIVPIALNPDAPVGLEPDLDDNSLGQIVYTSGTTAAPKGAMMTHKAMMSQYYSVIHGMDFAEADRALAALPLYHTAQTHAFTMPQLMVGTRTVLIEAPVPELVLRLIEQERITSFFAPPTVWISLLRHPDFAARDLSSLEKVYYGASIMPVPVLQELRQRLPRIRPYNCYGQTEIAPLATMLRPEEHDARPASCGRPCLNVETRVVDTDMNDVPPGTHGEIVHRSPHLLVGYWDKPAETAEAFAGGWFHSGDVGYFDEEGYLYIVDRIRDVINTGGVLVASREVEEVLFTHPAVSEVAVVGLPDDKWIEAVTAFVVLRPEHTVDEATLVAHARAHLAPYKLPKKVVFVDNLPRNTAGKLLKRELRKQYT